MKERNFCADSPRGSRNCPYANIVKEEGSFPVVIECETTLPNGEKKHETIERVYKNRVAVYCKRYSDGVGEFVGTIEPYGGGCKVPISCPELEFNKKKQKGFLRFFSKR